MRVLLFQKINITNLTILLLFQVNLFFSCTKETGREKEEGAIVADLWMRPRPPGVRMVSIYGKIQNNGSYERKILSWQSSSFSSLEMHESKLDEKGIMRMKEIPLPVVLPVGESNWEPGSTHIMGIGAVSEKEEEAFLEVQWEDGKKSVWKVEIRK
ncbi:copper chaperone PCu(A)C [Leptospira idonii]|nr:copper chaperone PCu(A)C [Leptospira idonii]